MPQEKPSAIDLLHQVCDIMADRDLTEIYLREGDITLRVRRGIESASVSFPAPTYNAPTVVQQTEASNPHGPPQLPEEVGELIRSPMPGTFYRSPHPDEPPYVEVGSVVSEEDTLCLIEAMKIFNDVKPDFACEILEILLENADAIEYGQPLFRVKKR